MVLNRETACLNLLQCTMPDSQLSLFVRITVDNKLNNDAFEVFSIFEGRCRALVRQ